MRFIAIKLIRAYQIVLSPFVGWHCRFQPSCSAYSTEAILRHGVLRGSVLTAKRLLRCRPGGGDGFDPVPDATDLDKEKRDLS